MHSALHLLRFTAILASEFLEEARFLGLLRCDFSAPQRAEFLACLCSIGNVEERLLILCCFPLHMRNEVWTRVSSRYTVVSHGRDTSRQPLHRDEKVSFSLLGGLSPCTQIDKKTDFLQ